MDNGVPSFRCAGRAWR